jgi:elongation factor G
MPDLQSRRAIIQGSAVETNYQVLKCEIPAAELSNFSTQLRSITQGRAIYSTKFKGYNPVPSNIQEGLIKEHQIVTV